VHEHRPLEPSLPNGIVCAYDVITPRTNSNGGRDASDSFSVKVGLGGRY
jgi:hypothetical protein